MPSFTIENIIESRWADKVQLWDWTLDGLLDGEPATIGLSTKAENALQVGQTFDVDYKGREHQGIPQYRRVNAQYRGNGGSQRSPAPRPAPRQGQGANRPSGAPAAAPQKRQAMPYERAVALYRRIAEDFAEPAHATTIFLSVMRGEIAAPSMPPPVVKVKYRGKMIETAGVGQEAWDKMMGLIDFLGMGDDEAKAILARVAGVHTRKALDAEKAEIYLSALEDLAETKRALQRSEDAEPPPPTDDDESAPF